MKTILTDCDGVLLSWEKEFNAWMENKGYYALDTLSYSIGDRYGIDKMKGKQLIREFNESAHIGFLSPLRDAVWYVRKLHYEYGFKFHVITSLTLDPASCKLRTMNLKNLFGEDVFQGFTYLDTGADKYDALWEYLGMDYWWIEDKIVNAEAGIEVGLRPILVEHGHNMHYSNPAIPRLPNWKSIHDHIVST